MDSVCEDMKELSIKHDDDIEMTEKPDTSIDTEMPDQKVPLSDQELDREISEYFDRTCIPFKKHPASFVFNGDNQYDIDSFIEHFDKFYRKLTQKAPPEGMFQTEVSKRCKKESRPSARSLYGEQYNEDDGDEFFHEDDEWEGRNKYYRHDYRYTGNERYQDDD